ncbi:MAG: DUF1206 domain-containing protein [Acidimicrobiales bacterium]
MTATSVAHRAHHRARRAADSPWIDRVARAGFVARGVVYGTIGVIALQVARNGGGGSEANKQGALREIAERPFGRPLLVALALGLAGYALWRLTEALWGKRDEDDEKKRTAKRLGSGARAVFYGAFCVTTVRFILHGASQGGANNDQQQQSFVARVLGWPAGQWLVAAAGVVIIGGALYIGYRGLSQKFEERLDTSDMGPVAGPTVGALGTVGMVARSAVFALAGYLLIRAAIDFDPREAQGVDGTLKTMAHQSYGQVILVAVAIGLLAYGLYSWAEARYREL